MFPKRQSHLFVGPTVRATFAILAYFIWLSLPAEAGLFFCNNTGQTVSVAIGYNVGNKWVSRGWYNIKPRECSGTALVGKLDNRYYYYYAESVGSGLRWGGKQRNDTSLFCTRSDSFLLEHTPDCNATYFRKIDTGDDDQHVFTLTEKKKDPLNAALACRERRNDFARCWLGEMATAKQRQILRCTSRAKSASSTMMCAYKANLSGADLRMATCAERYSNTRRGGDFLNCISQGHLNEDQARIFQCAIDKNGNLREAASCALEEKFALTPEQQRVYNCVAANIKDLQKAAICSAGSLLNSQQMRIVDCVIRAKGSYVGMAICAFGEQLTPEQQAFADCAISTGGEPLSFASCVGSTLTKSELEKCLRVGVGGDNGCFGKNNSVRVAVSNAWKDVTQGPGPSNDLLGRDGFVGRKMRDIASDFSDGPGENNDLVGSRGYVRRKLGDIQGDVEQGPGSSNDLVGKDGWVCQRLGC